MPSVASAGPGPGTEECGVITGAGAVRWPRSGCPLGQYNLLLLKTPYGTRCWQSMAMVALQHGMTWKASLWARRSCPSRSFPEPCGRPGFWEPQATWLSSHPSEPEQVFRSAWLPLPYPPFLSGLRVDFTPARPEAPAPFLRSHLPSSRRS